MDKKRDMKRIEFILQMTFYILVIAMVVVFFLYKNTETPRLFLVPAGGALVVRIIGYILRFSNR